ncbi:type VII secretion-associated serine protease mycosin [Flindersiella endophytica]
MRARHIGAATAAAAIMLPILAAGPAASATPARGPAQLRLELQDCEVEARAASSKVPWEQEQTRFKDVWSMFGNKGQNITVAVVDSGLQLDERQSTNANYPVHPQLKDMRVVPGADFTNSPGLSERNDCDGHGTGVASIIAAQSCVACKDDAGKPIKVPFVGVAPEATIMPIRVKDKKDDRVDSEAIGKGMQFAVDQGVDIINVSLETTQDWPSIRAAVKAAYDKGIVIVAAAGNHGDSVAYPAKYAAQFPNVISVGAIDENGAMMPESGKASNATIAAPGVGVHTAESFFGNGNDQGAGETGTSFAAPFVSGVVALMKVQFPDLTPAQIRRRLELTAIRPGIDVPDPQMGYGMIDPVAAITKIVPSNVDPRPTVPGGQVIPDLPKQAAADTRVRDLALLAFGIAAGLALATLAFATVYRRGRARSWRPGVQRPAA